MFGGYDDDEDDIMTMLHTRVVTIIVPYDTRAHNRTFPTKFRTF